jgi:hypothetical protein
MLLLRIRIMELFILIIGIVIGRILFLITKNKLTPKDRIIYPDNNKISCF